MNTLILEYYRRFNNLYICFALKIIVKRLTTFINKVGESSFAGNLPTKLD